jgi:predicted flap endonuclease-1-like 5' DNA nuclease
MSPDLSVSLPFILIALVLFVLAVWVLARTRRKARVIEDGTTLARDVLDEGAAKAGRNQALIDAAPAAAIPVPEPTPAPAPAPIPAPVTAATGGDDLTRIKGLGPKIAALLADQGITSFAQIAAWSDDDVARFDAAMGRFKGRITRDQWVEQARMLATGDELGFSEKFGKNG